MVSPLGVDASPGRGGGVCGQEGAGGRLSLCAPGPLPMSRPRPLLSGPVPSALPAPTVRTQPGVPFVRPVPLALSSPPSLAHKQDGGCCFLPLPNPPYRIAVAAAAGNEPRWGGRVRQRGAEPGLRGAGRGRGLDLAAHTMGEAAPGAVPTPITGSAQGPNAVDASANSPGVTRWLPLKGRS